MASSASSWPWNHPQGNEGVMAGILTAAQLRRKHRDRAWRQWRERSWKFQNKLEFALRKYFAVERAKVLKVLNRVTLKAAEVDELADTWADIPLDDLRRQLQEQLEDNNDDWEDGLLMLLLLVAASFTSLTTF